MRRARLGQVFSMTLTISILRFRSKKETISLIFHDYFRLAETALRATISQHRMTWTPYVLKTSANSSRERAT